MPFNFPSSPTVGQESVQNGRNYKWTGSAWEIVTVYTDFSSNVNALLPVIANNADNRVLTGTGNTTGISAENNLTFDGSFLNVAGSGSFSNNVVASGFVRTGGTNGQFLKADGSVDSTSYQPLLTNPVTGTGIINHVAYWNSSSGVAADSGQLVWDATNNRLGIGTTSPSGKLHVIGNSYSQGNLYITRTGATVPLTYNSLTVDTSDNLIIRGGDTQLLLSGQGGGIAVTAFSQGIEIGNSYNAGTTSQNIRFSPAATERMRITNTGRVGIGTTAPSGQLHVVGTGIISSRLGIGTSNPNSQLHVIGSGFVSSVTGIAPNSLLHLYSATSGASIFNVEGTNGSLFSVDDNLSGTLMSVNNNAGLPVFEVFSDDRVVAGRFNQNDFVVNSSGNIGIGNSGDNSYKLNVTGSGNFTGEVLASGNITGRRLAASRSSGSEGGILSLAKPASGASTSGTFVNIDMFNNQLRIYEAGSPNRGYYLDITSASNSVGTQLITGTKTYAVFNAMQNQPPATSFATLDTRNSIAVLDFDAATKESSVFVGIIPEGANLTSGLNIIIHWMATSATSGDVVWEVSLERSNTDLDSDSFDTAATGTSSANVTSGIVTKTTIVLSTIDSIAAGDLYRLKVSRDAANGADTMTGDAELVAVEVRG